MFDCKTCGAKLTVRSAFCSAGVDLVCQGRDPNPGCGAVLTAEERHYYGDACEQCEVAWADRIETWRRGSDDSELDQKYGCPSRTTH
jgi:hypothetical protein